MCVRVHVRACACVRACASFSEDFRKITNSRRYSDMIDIRSAFVIGHTCSDDWIFLSDEILKFHQKPVLPVTTVNFNTEHYFLVLT
jgi:hypothetical protein